MIIYKTYTISICIILIYTLSAFSSKAYGQNMFLEMKLEGAGGTTKFQDPVGEGSNSSQGNGLSISLSSQLYKGIYFKTSLGSSTIVSELDTDIGSNDIKISQYSIAVLPELRLGDTHWLYLNAGVGTNILSDVALRRNQSQIRFFGDELNVYYPMHIGAQKQFKDIAALIEFGLRYTQYFRVSGILSEIRLQERLMRIGISYKLK